jgi:hypothetical protein
MKYNKHYKAPRAASKKRNPAKKKTVQKRSNPSSKKMSTEDALLAQGVPGYIYPQVEDMRKDKSKSGTLAALSEIVIKNDQPKIFALVDSSAIKNPKPIKNAKKAAKKEKTAEELEAETLKNIIANLDASQSGREKIMASVKLQSIGGQIMSPIPKNPEAAFSLGLYQGILTIKTMCPTYKIPGISLIKKDAANILATIKARKETEKETVLELARRGTFDQDEEGVEGYSFTDMYTSLEPKSELRSDLGALKDRLPDNPFIAHSYGYRLGMQYGLEACPFKWIPFVPAFRKLRDQIQNMDRLAAQEEARQWQAMQQASEADRAMQQMGLQATQRDSRRRRPQGVIG